MTTPPSTPVRATVHTIDDRSARIERVFNAPRTKVWRAHTDPALVAQWWGRGNTVVIERLELVKGGHWRFIEHSDHGEHGFEGRYREVTPETRLSYTFEWDGMPGHVIVETVNFEEIDGGTRTRLVIDASFHTAEDCAGMLSSGMEEGMNQSYAALDRVLAGLQ
jgi:uncharacterized protein YndB with AHSA1/START domain